MDENISSKTKWNKAEIIWFFSLIQPSTKTPFCFTCKRCSCQPCLFSTIWRPSFIFFGRKKYFSHLLDLGKFLPIHLPKAPLVLVIDENVFWAGVQLKSWKIHLPSKTKANWLWGNVKRWGHLCVIFHSYIMIQLKPVLKYFSLKTDIIWRPIN